MANGGLCRLRSPALRQRRPFSQTPDAVSLEHLGATSSKELWQKPFDFRAQDQVLTGINAAWMDVKNDFLSLQKPAKL